MYIAHISDLHIGAPSKPGEENLKRVIGEINRFCVPFDCVLVTGDIVHGSARKHYAEAFALLNELKVPYYLIPGNKDGTDNLIGALRTYYPFIRFRSLATVCSMWLTVIRCGWLRLILLRREL